MKIHTDILTAENLTAAAKTLGRGVKPETASKGSRSHSHAFDVSLAGKPGKDRHGMTRKYSTGGAYGSTDGTMRACTWIEWGDFIAELFKVDPAAKIGPYRGAAEFLARTYADAEQRDRFNTRKDVYYGEHADRWDAELYDVEAVENFCAGYQEAEHGDVEHDPDPEPNWQAGVKMAQANAVEDDRKANRASYGRGF